jgi:TusA-related sulfurtransferase
MTDCIGAAMVTFDLRTSIIPFALLEISNHFKKMKPGEVIEILSDEAGIEKDLKCILPKAQYEITRLDSPALHRGTLFIRLRKVPTC